ncbi:hypothetical protein [Bergeyella sp. RCAD1439]|uniref:hypothetical protein n=1 Tax=Bergeyella anatis TaxID=3113737 RepID=UPI002E19C361|nr:hypothetical protein [Bergeyella sp. RCAD1439]
MTTEKISKLFLIGLLVIFLGVFFYGRFVNMPKYKNGRYTIGTFDKFSVSKGGGYTVYFTYSVGKNEYKGNSGVFSGDMFDRSFIGKKFLVIFVNVDELSSIYIDIPVPDSIKSAPAEGWKELPEWAKKENE